MTRWIGKTSPVGITKLEQVGSNMDIITIDWETYYDKEVGFSKLTTQQYVMHPEFEEILIGIAINDDEPEWYPQHKIAERLNQIDWANSALLAQNTNFDGAILAWHHGHIPALYLDTMAMANCTGVSKLARGASLSAQAKFFNDNGYPMPFKGTEVGNAMGFKYKDFSAEHLMRYANYCMDDVRITKALFDIYVTMVPTDELLWHDLVIRMFVQPQFVLDEQAIKDELARVHERRAQVQSMVMERLGVTNETTFLSTIMSNQKFAKALEEEGCEPPKKISKTTGKETLALARTDAGMMELLEHESENVRALVEARLGLKSSIEVTRCEHFLALSKLGAMAMPYKVSGTATHRLSGCVTADTIIICKTKEGKVEQTEITDVGDDALVWDGVEFVQHEGVAWRGVQEVIVWDGIRGTKNHPVYVEGQDEPMGLYDAMIRDRSIINAELPQEIETCERADYEASPTTEWAHVYDIVNAGPRHRFVANGKLIHNSDGVNVQNLPSGRKPGQSKALRRSISAPEGYNIVVGDSGQVEVRVLAYVAQQTDLLELFIKGKDPYIALASKLYKRTYDDLKAAYDADNEEAALQRNTGKIGVLSLGYGAGWKSTQNIAKVQYGVHMDDDTVQALVDVYRTENYKVPKMWNIVEDALNRMVAGFNGNMLGPGDNLYFYDGQYKLAGQTVPGIRLPDGVWLVFPNLRHTTEVKNNRSYVQLIYDNIEGRKVVPNSIWGGSATGLLIQATAFSIIKYQGLMMMQKGIRPALNSHDEFAFTTPKEYTELSEKLLVQCMTSKPEWVTGTLPLKCSYGAAERYGDAKS